jgi:hypothetical protein
MDTRLQLAGMTEAGMTEVETGSLLTTGEDDKRGLQGPHRAAGISLSLSFPTFFIGNPSWSISDGSPPTTCGDDRRKMDTCHTHADMTKERWIPA